MSQPSTTGTGLGIVGLGAAAVRMIQAAKIHPGIHVAAVCDTSDSLLDMLATIAPATYNSLDSLLEDPAVEVIYIATPTHLHGKHATAALDSGRDVLVEKPMASSAVAAKELAQHAESLGRTLVVGHSLSFEPFVKAAAAAALDYELGPLLDIVYLDESDWVWQPRLDEEFDETLGGGPVMRQGAHLVDVVRYLASGATVVNVHARGVAAPGRRCTGAFTANLELDSGTRALLHYNGMLCTSSTSENSTASVGAAKEERNRALLRELLDTAPSRPASAGPARRITAMYEHGVVSIHDSGGHVAINSAAISLNHGNYPSGRHSVLDELLIGREGGPVVHDGAWGAANLQVCEAILESVRSQSSASGLA